ncbi:MAG: response regulator [Cyanomargarita calcarea GSE-NOS-MK-12-04C]|jgi:chemotaxis family two-component system response regulator PixG|uniref:Protein PatA n=1 Tax=Cyanomargarita calcarea GSE-NOS-MK-12-04C TaxID=2839659 RepID=A0A951QUH9_9CYAN|nr:response regulator [Cyanomargarita calcarea GSE-NOS-MK-12-04C]
MVYPDLSLPNNVFDEFQACNRLQYSGKLDLQSSKGHKWSFYYRLGRIVWATGGNHPFRRWRRQMIQHCPNINIDKMQLFPSELEIDYWDYQLLEVLYKEQKIQRQEINTIVDSTIAELLFDLAQQGNFSLISCDRNQQVILEAPMSLSSTYVSLKYMSESWQNWSEAGLANFSPDLALILRQPEQLRNKVSSAAYNNFVKLMNGKYTLRDLALKMKQNVLSVTRSLRPYILTGILELVEVPDFEFPVSKVKNNITSIQAYRSDAPLIACVDDSPQVCQMLEKMITLHGMRFVAIQDPVKILSTLIEQKPDLILLDLVMPVASGYEICSQLRRVSGFINTPIIILTGSEALFDRVRAKVVGSTDFITKPVVADKVMAVVQKHLKTAKTAKSTYVPSLSLAC